jgi:hypothetical protein
MGNFNLMKLTILLVFITSSFFALAQSIPNAGFENWTECSSAAEPIPFQTSNAISNLLSGSLSVEQSTNAYGGSYAAFVHADASQEIQGFMTLGQDFNTGETTPLPFTGTPDSISFWAQHTISELDFGSVVFTLYEDMMEVGYGAITFNGSTSGYTYYSSPVNIEAGATPNGMTFGISSGGDASLNGELYIDDIHLIYNTGTGDDIPGGDFENWNITSAQCLDSWYTSNGFTLPNLSVEQGEPHSGNHSARITNQPTSFGGGSLGYILLGNPESDFCDDSSLLMPFGEAVTIIGGFYKYTAGNANEMATLFISYTASNDAGGCDSIYEYYQYMPPASDWTEFVINIPPNIIAEWQPGNIPEYLTLGFVSTVVSDDSEPNGDPNSVLLVDDIELTYTTILDIENETMSTGVSFYPNPSLDVLNVLLPSHAPTAIQLIDSTGKTVSELNVSTDKATIITEQLPNGIYTLLVNKGRESEAYHVVVQH